MFSGHESVGRSSFSSVGSLFHAGGAATEKVLSPIRRRIRRSAAWRGCHTMKRVVTSGLGILATDVRRPLMLMLSGVCARSDLWTSKNLFWILSMTDNQRPVQLLKSWSHLHGSCGLRSRTVRVAAWRTRWNGASVEAGIPASIATFVWKSDTRSQIRQHWIENFRKKWPRLTVVAATECAFVMPSGEWNY